MKWDFVLWYHFYFLQQPYILLINNKLQGIVVVATTKIDIFKQITTSLMPRISVSLLLLLPQR